MVSAGTAGSNTAERSDNTDINSGLVTGLPVDTSSHASCNVMHGARLRSSKHVLPQPGVQ